MTLVTEDFTNLTLTIEDNDGDEDDENYEDGGEYCEDYVGSWSTS